MPQFTMSMYANKEDLYKAKSDYYEKEIKNLTERLRLADMFIDNIDDRKYKQMRATYKTLVKAI